MPEKKYRIIILGAGFSKPAGLPLANELWAEILRRSGSLWGRAEKFLEDLDDYIQFRRDCDGIELTRETVNFEEFLGFLDIEHYLGLRGSDTWSRDGNEGQVVVKTLIGEILIDHHEEAVFKFLETTGVVIDDLILNYETSLLAPPQTQIISRTSWDKSINSSQLLLRPLVIGLRLRDISDAYYSLWSRFKVDDHTEKRRLMQLFDAAHIPSGLLPDDSETWPAKTYAELERRLSEIKTDFVLEGGDRKVLDLAAYILVHGKLEPALTRWSEIARNRLNSK